jgi:hypothetical protein
MLFVRITFIKYIEDMSAIEQNLIQWAMYMIRKIAESHDPSILSDEEWLSFNYNIVTLSMKVRQLIFKARTEEDGK